MRKWKRKEIQVTYYWYIFHYPVWFGVVKRRERTWEGRKERRANSEKGAYWEWCHLRFNLYTFPVLSLCFYKPTGTCQLFPPNTRFWIIGATLQAILFHVSTLFPLWTPLRVNNPNISGEIPQSPIILMNTGWNLVRWISQGHTGWIHFTRRSNEIHPFKNYNFFFFFFFFFS